MTDYKEFRSNLGKTNAKLAQALPKEMQGFGALHKAALEDGALDPKTKELIALGISIGIRCEPCVVSRTKTLIDLGATREEVEETIGVALVMGGGPATAYGGITLEVFDQFSE